MKCVNLKTLMTIMIKLHPKHRNANYNTHDNTESEQFHISLRSKPTTEIMWFISYHPDFPIL